MNLLQRSIERGRPFGGLGIFIRKSVCNSAQCLTKSENEHVVNS